MQIDHRTSQTAWPNAAANFSRRAAICTRKLLKRDSFLHIPAGRFRGIGRALVPPPHAQESLMSDEKPKPKRATRDATYCSSRGYTAQSNLWRLSRLFAAQALRVERDRRGTHDLRGVAHGRARQGNQSPRRRQCGCRASPRYPGAGRFARAAGASPSTAGAVSGKPGEASKRRASGGASRSARALAHRQSGARASRRWLAPGRSERTQGSLWQCKR